MTFFSIVSIVGSSLILGISGLIALEVPPVARWASLKLMRAALLRLPARVRVVREEEWAAEMEALDKSNIFRVILAARFLYAANKIAASESSAGMGVPPIAFTIREIQLLGAANSDGQYPARMVATDESGRAYFSSMTLQQESGTNKFTGLAPKESWRPLEQ